MATETLAQRLTFAARSGEVERYELTGPADVFNTEIGIWEELPAGTIVYMPRIASSVPVSEPPSPPKE